MADTTITIRPLTTSLGDVYGALLAAVPLAATATAADAAEDAARRMAGASLAHWDLANLHARVAIDPDAYVDEWQASHVRRALTRAHVEKWLSLVEARISAPIRIQGPVQHSEVWGERVVG